MFPINNYAIHQGKWVNPLASSYIKPVTQSIDELAKIYPVVSSWIRSDRVTLFDRSVTYSVAAGQTLIQAVNLTGGFDALVFDRKAAVVFTDGPLISTNRVLPNQTASYVRMSISRQNAEVDMDEAPINSNMGFGWRPNTRPVPEFWRGADIREISINNDNGFAIRVTLTFTLALL